jgi:DNA-directed RNA polymerase subunit M/transcription elongation factor TFIIS
MDRENNIKKISKLVKKKIAQQIEESIYLFSVAYTEESEMIFLLDSIYSDKFNEIYNLLLNNKSKFLINALELKKIDPTKIAYMKPDELNPDKYEKIIKKKEIEDFKKKNMPTSSAYKCPKCGEKKITITERQTRAADEPATIYMECNACGYININDGT